MDIQKYGTEYQVEITPIKVYNNEISWIRLQRKDEVNAHAIGVDRTYL